MDSITIHIFQILTFLFSVVVHEVSHGVMALRLGDNTAQNEGRLTLNPIPHLDPVGSILLPLLLIVTNSPFIIGWAKPVPYNPMQLHKDMKYGPLKVALVGPGSNLVIAILVGGLLRMAGGVLNEVAIALLVQIVFINVLLAVFNLIPIPPLDGSKILTVLLPFQASRALQSIETWGIALVFLMLMFFGEAIFYITTIISALIIGPIPAF